MHHYEQLDLWKRGITLAGHLHRSARAARAQWRDRALWDQISRAAMSIPANVAEGSLRGTDREFARFLGIAMGSAAELHSFIKVALASGVLEEAEARTLANEAVALRRMASALRARAGGYRPRPLKSQPGEAVGAKGASTGTA